MSNKPKEYKRLQIDLTLESFDRMEKMKEMAGLSSYTQVIGRSLHAYEFLLKHQSSDKKLMLVDEKGNQTEIVLL